MFQTQLQKNQSAKRDEIERAKRKEKLEGEKRMDDEMT